jgi:hypothetical protein
MLKLIYIIMSIVFYVTLYAALTIAAFVILGLMFGVVVGTLAAVVVAAFGLINILQFVYLEGSDRRLISWWPTPGYNWPLSSKFLLILAVYLLIGFVIYKGVSSGNPTWPSWIPTTPAPIGFGDATVRRETGGKLTVEVRRSEGGAILD